MEREDRIVLRDMIIIMILFGSIAQIVSFAFPGDHVKMAVGLWIGVAAGIGFAIHIRDTLEEALMRGVDGARRYVQRGYAIRCTALLVIVTIVSYFQLADIVMLLIGVMGLKVSGYLQPILHEVFEKVRNFK